jgi:GNAT superfamily N-acetyltransferase
MRKLFFCPDLVADFEWRGVYALRAGSVRPQNKKQISEGLRDMSPESIRNRFLGSKRDFSEQELKYLTVLDGWNHYAFGVEELEGKRRGVAVIRLVRSSFDIYEAEVAITIIDEYHKIGLGTLLIDCIILAAKERAIRKLSFTFLPQNEAIMRLISKAGVPIHGPQFKDYVQMFLDIEAMDEEVVKARLRPNLPMIENFHSGV